MSAPIDEEENELNEAVEQGQLLEDVTHIESYASSSQNFEAYGAIIAANYDGTFSITPDKKFNGITDTSYEISGLMVISILDMMIYQISVAGTK